MAQKIEIESTSKSDSKNCYEMITHIGGVNHCRKWRMTEAKAIEYIENGTYIFFIYKDYAKLDVVIAKTAGSHKYLKTSSDGDIPQNLIKLKACPED
jgi:hypothetical protein